MPLTDHFQGWPVELVGGGHRQPARRDGGQGRRATAAFDDGPLTQQRPGPDLGQPPAAARSGSSSAAWGTPKVATTASPMNFSTWPPWSAIPWAAPVK